jgi:adenylate cyclase
VSIRRAQVPFARLPLGARIKLGVVVAVVTINSIGALAAFLLAILVVPLPVVYDVEQAIRNLTLLALLAPAALFFGLATGLRLTHQTLDWLVEGRRPWPDEQRHVLAAPDRVFAFHALFWAVATVIFGAYNAFYDPWLGFVAAATVALSGLTVSSIAYLTTERLTRPLARQALRRGVPERVRVRSVAARTMFAWLLGTGVSLFGIIIIGINTLADSVLVSTHQLAVTVLVLGLVSLLIGGTTMYAAARASADPVRGLRQAFAEVSQGNLGTQVQIYDGTEIGHLQAGFNTMVAGLRERERLRDLFGRHVGGDVVRSALEGTVQLGGETRRVAVLFVDIIGVSELTREHSPAEVVALLNRFLQVVVEVVHEHGGWINKFEDDGVLAIWGAPDAVEDMEAKALAAARMMADRLRREVTELDAGIGVSAGRAVAGNVGAAERYEYTVIGDPVNEAARLTDLAKDKRGRVAVNATLLDAAGDEADHWTERKPVHLRGRGTVTRLATPLHGSGH